MISDGTISGGMIPKIDNCLDVAKMVLKEFVLLMEEKITQYFLNLLSDKGSGTLIRE